MASDDDGWNDEDEAEYSAWFRFVDALQLRDVGTVVSLVRTGFRRRAAISAWLDTFKTGI